MAKPLTPWSRAPLVPETSEHAHQSALFMWAKFAERFGYVVANNPDNWNMPFAALEATMHPDFPYQPMPQLKWFHAIKNQGHGDAVRGNQSRAEGVKAGVLDCFLPVTVYGDLDELKHAGLYLEMKRIGGKTSEKQAEFINDMEYEGYACAVAEGWIAGRDVLLKYLLTT